MSFLNINLNVTAYEDSDKTLNPLLKYFDFSWSLLGMPTAQPKMVPVDLAPLETKTIMTVERTLSFTALTSFSIVQVGLGPLAQLQGNFGARTARLDGDGTTQWAVTKTNSLVRFTFTGTGTAPTFGGMVSGDGITILAPFSTLNQGDFTIVKVGANYVEFNNALGVAETVVGQVDIYSSGPVQIGDTLDLTSSQFVNPNQGQFVITRVTDAYIEFSNENAVPETVTGVTTGLSIYPEAFSWMLMNVDHKCRVVFNADTGIGSEVAPMFDGDLINSPGLFLKRGKIFRIDISNLSLDPAKGFIVLAE